MFHWRPKIQIPGLGLGLVMEFAPSLGWNLPYWLKVAGFGCGVVMVVWPGLAWLEDKFYEQKVARRQMISFIGMLWCAAGFIFFAGTFLGVWGGSTTFGPQKAVPAVNTTTHPPEIATDYSVNGGTITGRAGGPTSNLRMTVVSLDSARVGWGEGASFILTMVNDDTEPAYIQQIRLIEIYLYSKAQLTPEQFNERLRAAVSGSALAAPLPDWLNLLTNIGKTGMQYINLQPESVKFNGRESDSLLQIPGNSISEIRVSFKPPAIDMAKKNAIIEAMEFDVVNPDGTIALRICPISTTQVFAGGGTVWSPFETAPIQIIPNNDQTVFCRSAKAQTTNPPVLPPATLVQQ